MVYRVVSTKLTEEEHSKLLDECAKQGCTPSSFVKNSIMEKIEPKSEQTKPEQTLVEELPKATVFEPRESRRKPTLEESIEHMKTCLNPNCKYGSANLLKKYR